MLTETSCEEQYCSSEEVNLDIKNGWFFQKRVIKFRDLAKSLLMVLKNASSWTLYHECNLADYKEPTTWKRNTRNHQDGRSFSPNSRMDTRTPQNIKWPMQSKIVRNTPQSLSCLRQVLGACDMKKVLQYRGGQSELQTMYRERDQLGHW